MKIARLNGLKKIAMLATLIACFVGAKTPIFAQKQDKIAVKNKEKKLEKTFDKVIADHLLTDSVGCTILIAKKGEIIHQKAFGKADLSFGVPTQTTTIFELGSLGKQFAAVAVLRLFEQGKLDLQDDIRKYFPDFETSNYTITIENLLTHTSGITDDVKEFDENRLNFSAFSKQQMLDFFRNIPLKFEPGTEVSYSSPAYLMLGYIIEKITGKKYAEYLDEQFFKPLQMKNTYATKNEKIVANKARGYERNDRNEILNARVDNLLEHFCPAGGLEMTIEDYYKWHRALFGYKLIKAENLQKATTKFRLKNGRESNFGYGFEIGNAFGIPIIHHGGRTFGFNSHEMYAPEEDVLVVVLNNQSMLDLTSLTTILVHLAAGKDYNFEEIKVADNVLETYVGKYKWNEITDQHVKIFRVGKKLMFQDSYSTTASEMHFIAENSFFIYGYGFMMKNTFLKDKTGKITGFNVKGNGESFDAKKVE
jgi:CubicO group peptidase (beta-lactamase class C family)